MNTGRNSVYRAGQRVDMNTVQSLIDQQAADRPDEIFLIVPESGKTVTYAQLQAHSRMIAGYLAAMGIAEDEKVAFLLPNGYWSAVLFLGVMYSGRVIVPLNAVSGEAALSYVIEHSDSRVILADDRYIEKFSGLMADFAEDITIIRTDVNKGPQWSCKAVDTDAKISMVDTSDASVLIYTSGTTGQPKGVILSHGNTIAGGRNTMIAHDLDSRDRALCVLPLYHINGEMVTVMGPLVSGGSLVIPERFSCSTFWNHMTNYNCTWFSVVPTIIAYLLEDAERNGFNRSELAGLKNMRFGRSASSALAPEMHKAFEDRFDVPVIETMGLTETAAQILSNPMPPAKPKYGSPGLAVGNEAKVIDEQGNECPVGVSGELMIRGDNVLSGYYKNEEATCEALEPDGWLHTGDIAMKDEDGFFFITGRIKELIIKGGENIAPREIDEALYEHPAILEAAGFGYPDKHYGQEVMACVALKPGMECSESELSEFTVSMLGTFKSPKRIFFMKDLPKGPSGKIQRLKLADMVDI